MVYHFVSRTKTRDKIATMYDMLIIYIVAKKTLWKAYKPKIYTSA